MPEVPEHLVPTDGLTNSFIRFGGLDTTPDSGFANMRFDIYDEQGGYLATFNIPIAPNERGSVDMMIADAHREMTNVLRQWIYEVDTLRMAYEKPAAR
ncbi:hypothetical protein U1839_14535 [Sphingomonas sp. RT2P30]|uniref:hypothetical protein n=1 Tax=Parasphingomonas halimpatiens TaxID=3096162 RepID=UPI002FC6A042